VRKAVVVGAIGRRRKILKDVLESKGSKVICFVDNICSEREYDGVPNLSLIPDPEGDQYLPRDVPLIDSIPLSPIAETSIN